MVHTRIDFNCSNSRYNEEDDQLETYVEKLLLEEKSKDLNVYPIMKAKQLLSLGRFVLQCYNVTMLQCYNVTMLIIILVILQRCPTHSS